MFLETTVLCTRLCYALDSFADEDLNIALDVNRYMFNLIEIYRSKTLLSKKLYLKTYKWMIHM